MDYQKLTVRLVERCLRQGADSAEVYLQSSRELTIRVLNAEIETIEETVARGIGFRVVVEGKMGFSHCNDLSTQSLEDTIGKAIAFARLTTPDENNILPSDHPFSNVTGLFDPEIARISMEKKIHLAMEVEALARKDPRITHSSGSSFGEGESEIFIANSNGLAKSYKAGGCSINVGVVAEKGDQKNTGWENCSRRFFADLEPLEKIASIASQRAWELLDPLMIKTQRASVIFDPLAVRSLLGGVITALNGERVLQGASFLKNFLNQKFASDLLTFTDDGTIPKGLDSTPFDGEGVPTAKRTLVEKGVVKSFIYNTQVAKRAGVESTGNASRSNFNSLPGIGTHNIVVLPGTYTQEEIIASTKRGLLLRGITGLALNPVIGNFSGGVSGFWIENGKIIHPVKGITIAGSANEILNGIEMIGNDIDLKRSFAAPSIKITEMQIGGA